MRSLILALTLASVPLFACASTPPPPARTPATTTRTTGAQVPNDSYGTSDENAGWSDPAGAGMATHGSAEPGAASAPMSAPDAGLAP